MRVVLSGGTGYIGGAVLARCLEHSYITSILLLTRRLPENFIENSKVKVIIVKDFTSYDEAVTAELQTADAAIWCLGTYNGDEKVDIEYPLAFINTIKSRSRSSTPFRYVQLGGALTEPPPKEGEQERTLWYYTNGRRIRGRTEAAVLASAEEDIDSKFTVYLVKPGGVLFKTGSYLQQWILGDSWTVAMDQLTATMVDLAVNGNEQKVFLNADLIKHGAKLLQKST